METKLQLRGVRQNNLKDVNLDLPLGKTIVVTGPSGSGKSSLAFETVYAEGQRRYMQSLSTYARQFMEKFQAPEVDSIRNIPPTIAVEQINPVRNSRATVGTSTELYDYLRLLFEKIGQEYCDGQPMERLTTQQITDILLKEFAGETLLICFRKKLPRIKKDAIVLLEDQLRNGFTRYLLKGKLFRIGRDEPPKNLASSEVDFVVDRLRISTESDQQTPVRLQEAIVNSLNMGGNFIHVHREEEGKYSHVEDYTNLNFCRVCKRTTDSKSATAFSFNSPLGACETCKGFGNILTVDMDLAIPNPAKSISQGAVDPFTKPSLNHWQKKLLEYCKKNRIDIDLPFKDLPKKHQKAIFEGAKGFKGVRGVFAMLEKEKYKMRVRVFLSRYNAPFTCPDCDGKRLKNSSLEIKVGTASISEICEFTFLECRDFFQKLKLPPRQEKIAEDLLRQVKRRLDTLISVGLGYLTLSRLTRSLSGGEYQRILLATQLSQGLTDTMYVLDEPSIGLHPKDTEQLLEVLGQLRKKGNSLLIVEHDPEIIEWAEHVLDMGPGSGSLGGNVVFSGSQARFALANTPTSNSLKEWKQSCRDLMEKQGKLKLSESLEITGASGNNLKNLDLSIPLNTLVAITGVSGSGKSTLIVDTVYQALAKLFLGKSEKIARFSSLSGFEHLSGVELVDQSPIGKSSRSNPITFMKGYDEIRALFSSTRQAVSKKLTPGHFSFNVPGGRCEECEGEGRIRIDMVFMEDVWVPCPTCEGRRFKPTVLEVLYRGKTIVDVLRMTTEDAFRFFEESSSLRNKLALLQEVGLGYLQLGQPSYTLSGGEAQRLKIARELSKTSSKKLPTLFILDEPTTGLHFNEVGKLIHVLRRLVNSGHSVIVIEHNIQLICAAQYVIDLGPDGGNNGGNVVAVGTPKELAQRKLAHTCRYLADIWNQK